MMVRHDDQYNLHYYHPLDDLVSFLPGTIIHPNTDSNTKTHSLPSLPFKFSMEGDKVLRVCHGVAQSRAAIYEVEIGVLKKRYEKKTMLMFVKDEEVPNLAMKTLKCKVRQHIIYMTPKQQVYRNIPISM